MDQSLLPSIYDFISHTYPFSQLSPLETDAVAAAIRICYKSTDDMLDNEDLAGAGLYMVRTGAAEEINKKDHSLRARLTVGDTFGYTQIDKKGQSDYFVRFPENTLLYFINRQVLQFLITKNHDVGEYFNSKEWVRLASTHTFDEDNGANVVAERTAKSVCRPRPVLLAEEDDVKKAACALSRQHCYMAVIKNAAGQLTGVLTSSDISSRVVAAGLPYDTKVADIMTRNVFTCDADESLEMVFESMIMHNVRCLPVTQNGDLYGLITTTELLQNSALEAVYLIRDVKNAGDLATLRLLSKQVRSVFISMLETRMRPHAMQRMMSRIADMFYERIITLTLADMSPPPCNFCFAAAGSLARNELQLLSDQDNAIITERPLSIEETEYFHTLSDRVCKALATCGYPLCEGNYMASNPKWCASYDEWTKKYDEWVSYTSSDALLNSMVFLDMRSLYGDDFLVGKLKKHLCRLVQKNTRFLTFLCQASTTVSPPLGTFRQFVLKKDGSSAPSLNIKSQAVKLIVELGRIYGLGASSMSTDTYQRLADAADAGLLKRDDFRELAEAYSFLNAVRFRHQQEALTQGKEPTNNLVPSELTQFERNHLRDAFRIISRHQAAALVRFAPGLGILG